MENISIQKIDVFNLIKRHKFVIGKFLLKDVFENSKNKYSFNKSIENSILKQFNNIKKGIF
jgi:hypothetical protein